MINKKCILTFILTKTGFQLHTWHCYWCILMMKWMICSCWFCETCLCLNNKNWVLRVTTVSNVPVCSAVVLPQYSDYRFIKCNPFSFLKCHHDMWNVIVCVFYMQHNEISMTRKISFPLMLAVLPYIYFNATYVFTVIYCLLSIIMDLSKADSDEYIMVIMVGYSCPLVDFAIGFLYMF